MYFQKPGRKSKKLKEISQNPAAILTSMMFLFDICLQKFILYIFCIQKTRVAKNLKKLEKPGV